MADNAGLTKAIEQVLANIQAQFSEIQNSSQEAQAALQNIQATGSEGISPLVPPLLRFQAASASLAASVDSLFRFVGSSANLAGGMPVVAPGAQAAVAPAAPQPVTQPVPAAQPPPAPVAAPVPVAPVAAPVAAAPVPVAAPIPVAPVVPEPAPAPVPVVEQAVAPAPATEPGFIQVEEAAPVAPVAPVAAAPVAESIAPVTEEVNVDTLPDNLKKLHKKAARFSRVAVQEFLLYKRTEADAGRQNKDLYKRFKEEIDKTKEQYDEKFRDISTHNIDYFYQELVKTLANNDVGALEGYPH